MSVIQSLIKAATVADRDPTTSDDATDGFSPGLLWINTATTGLFICLAADNPATWQPINDAALTTYLLDDKLALGLLGTPPVITNGFRVSSSGNNLISVTSGVAYCNSSGNTLRSALPANLTDAAVTGGQINDNYYANATKDGVTLNRFKIKFKSGVSGLYEVRLEPGALAADECQLDTCTITSGGLIIFSGSRSSLGFVQQQDVMQRVLASSHPGFVLAVPENNTWSGIAYGGVHGSGIFVAVAQTGTNRVMRSTDLGVTWGVVGVTSNTWNAIAYGSGVFIAVAEDGANRVMYSRDFGLNWTAVAAAEANPWKSIAFGNGVFVAVAGTGTNRVMRSTDLGVTWGAVSAAEANTWESVAYGNGVFVAVSSDGTNRVMRSTNDGASWSTVLVTANPWHGVTYGNGLFFLVGEAGDTAKSLYSSNGGVSWTTAAIQGSDTWLQIAYGNKVFLAISTNGSVQTNPNSTSWNIAGMILVGACVTYGEGIFVAINPSSNKIYRTFFEYSLS